MPIWESKRSLPRIETLGGRLYWLRDNSDMSVKKLAEVLGYSVNSFYGWESNKNAPSIWTIIDYSNYFKVSCDWILKGE